MATYERRLGKDMKLPGFRKVKVPPEMVVQRLGRQTVLTQALESSLGDWYERAMLYSGVNPVGDPKLDLSDLPEEGKPLRFSIEVAVRPGAELGEYSVLVGRRWHVDRQHELHSRASMILSRSSL